MSDYLKKQKRMKRFRNIVLIVTALIIFVYIGIEPYLAESFENLLPFQLVLFVLVLLSLSLLFLYESRYGKAEAFLEDMQYEISDAGSYISAREESTPEAYTQAVAEDMASCGYKLSRDIEVKELSFEFSAQKGSEFLYLTCLGSVDKNDVIAYLDAALFDITSNKMRSKGNALVVFVSDNAAEDAVALSKAITRVYNGKRLLRLGIAIISPESKTVYCRGNEPSVLQKLVASFVMNCELPLKEQFINKERLPFQTALEEKLAAFNTRDFKAGIYFER